MIVVSFVRAFRSVRVVLGITDLDGRGLTYHGSRRYLEGHGVVKRSVDIRIEGRYLPALDPVSRILMKRWLHYLPLPL